MINVLFAAHMDKLPKYEPALLNAIKEIGIQADLSMAHAPDVVDYIVYAPNSELQDFTPYTRCKAVLNLWAGVESIVDNKTLSQPLTRMVDTGLSEGMVEWVCGHVLRYHLDMDRNILGQDGNWHPHVPPLARDRQVAVLGLGALGEACATALSALNFHVSGWSRSQKTINGVTCYSGAAGLMKCLSQAEITVLLLPSTPATENILNVDTLGVMPKGAIIINPGRGPLIDDDALLNALETGQIAKATLDVFRVEPLPKDHPYWAHPNVTVTPHIASETRAEKAAQVIAENIRRSEAGEPLMFLVDQTAGY